MVDGVTIEMSETHYFIAGKTEVTQEWENLAIGRKSLMDRSLRQRNNFRIVCNKIRENGQVNRPITL